MSPGGIVRHALFAALTVCLVAATAIQPARGDGGSILRLTSDGRSFTRVGLGWSPDGKSIAFMKQFDEGSQLWIMNAEGSDAKAISKVGWQGNYGWSPDSKRLVYTYAERRDDTAEGGVYVYDLESGKSRALASGFPWARFEGDAAGKPLEFTRDSKQFVMLIKRTPEDDYRCEAHLFDIESGRSVALTPNHHRTFVWGTHAGSWSPDDTRFAMVSQSSETANGRVWICNRDGSGLHPITPADWFVRDDAVWSPDGEWMAFFTSHDRPADELEAGDPMCDLWLMRPDGKEAHPITHGSTPILKQRITFWVPRWTSDGRYLACAGVRTDQASVLYRGLYLVDVSSKELTTVLPGDPESDQDLWGFWNRLSITRDGRRLAFTVLQQTAVGRETGDPTYKERRDILYCYDIPTRTLHEVTRVRPSEDGIALCPSGRVFREDLYWSPLWSPDDRRLLFTKAKVISLEEGKLEPDLYVYTPEPAGAAETVVTPAPAAAPTPAPPVTARGASTGVVILPVRHRDAADAAKLLPATYSGAYTVDEARNALVAFSDPETVHSLERALSVLDRPVQRVMVDVLVTEMTRDGSRQLGLDWEYAHKRFGATLPLGPLAGAGEIFYQGVGKLDETFFTTLSALETAGEAKVRGNPRVLATSGTESTINIRRTDNFFFDAGTDYLGHPVRARSDISADTILKIRPVVLEGGRISLTIDATVDSFIFGTDADLPDTTRRQAATKLFCADGETVVIGGLTLEENTWARSKTPLLGDLPLIGQFFRKTRRVHRISDLAIFITPRVVGMPGEVEAAGLAPQ